MVDGSLAGTRVRQRLQLPGLAPLLLLLHDEPQLVELALSLGVVVGEGVGGRALGAGLAGELAERAVGGVLARRARAVLVVAQPGLGAARQVPVALAVRTDRLLAALALCRLVRCTRTRVLRFLLKLQNIISFQSQGPIFLLC